MTKETNLLLALAQAEGGITIKVTPDGWVQVSMAYLPHVTGRSLSGDDPVFRAAQHCANCLGYELMEHPGFRRSIPAVYDALNALRAPVRRTRTSSAFHAQNNMARSQYIYLIRYKACRTVLGGFTVKHEAHAWAKRTSGHPIEYLQLTQMRDGIGYDKDEKDIAWDMKLLERA